MIAAAHYIVAAPGKLNLCLFVGPPRADRLHNLVSVIQPVSLADRLEVTFERGDGPDAITCNALRGDQNIVEQAAALCRTTGLLNGVTATVRIEKRVPVAAGMGGGSGDAAAFLRAVCEFENEEIEDLSDLAFDLGADLPSQLRPGASLVRGAGELVDLLAHPLSPPPFFVVAPSQTGLSTADVFRRADELGQWHDLEQSEAQVRDALDTGSLRELLAISQNGLEPAILSLRPDLRATVESLRAHGASWAGFTGSGPTAFGVYLDADSAHAAQATLSAGHAGVTVTMPVEPQDWQVVNQLKTDA